MIDQVEIKGRVYPARMAPACRRLFDRWRKYGAAGALAQLGAIEKMMTAAKHGNERAWQGLAEEFPKAKDRRALERQARIAVEALRWLHAPDYMNECAVNGRRPEGEEFERRQTAAATGRKKLIEACKKLGIHRNEMPDFEKAKRAFRAASKKAHPDAGGSAERFRALTKAWDFVKAEYGWSD